MKLLLWGLWFTLDQLLVINTTWILLTAAIKKTRSYFCKKKIPQQNLQREAKAESLTLPVRGDSSPHRASEVWRVTAAAADPTLHGMWVGWCWLYAGVTGSCAGVWWDTHREHQETLPEDRGCVFPPLADPSLSVTTLCPKSRTGKPTRASTIPRVFAPDTSEARTVTNPRCLLSVLTATNGRGTSKRSNWLVNTWLLLSSFLLLLVTRVTWVNYV